MNSAFRRTADVHRDHGPYRSEEDASTQLNAGLAKKTGGVVVG